MLDAAPTGVSTGRNPLVMFVQSLVSILLLTGIEIFKRREERELQR